MKPHLQVFKRLTERLKLLRFTKRGTSWWQRKHGSLWQRVHIHKFTFAESFRVHSTIHIAGVEDEACSLTGIHSFDGWFERKRLGIPVRRFKFEYDDSPESISKCAVELSDYIEQCVIPWFEEWEDEKTLLTSSKSPLHDPQKQFLKELKFTTSLAHP